MSAIEMIEGFEPKEYKKRIFQSVDNKICHFITANKFIDMI